jgi:hypothetical protein
MNELKQNAQDLQTPDALIRVQCSEQMRRGNSIRRPHLTENDLSSLFRLSKDSNELDVQSLGEIEITSDAGSLARLLGALTVNSTVEGALTSYFSSLPEVERKARTAVVLSRMGEILPADVSAKLKRTHSFFTPAGNRQAKLSLLPALALISILSLSGIAFVLMVIGAFASYRHIAANFHPLRGWNCISSSLKAHVFQGFVPAQRNPDLWPEARHLPTKSGHPEVARDRSLKIHLEELAPATSNSSSTEDHEKFVR